MERSGQRFIIYGLWGQFVKYVELEWEVFWTPRGQYLQDWPIEGRGEVVKWKGKGHYDVENGGQDSEEPQRLSEALFDLIWGNGKIETGDNILIHPIFNAVTQILSTCVLLQEFLTLFDPKLQLVIIHDWHIFVVST